MDNYVGKRIDGRYEILEIIGVGGMAVVYKAYDNLDGKTVAVKVLKNEFSDDQDTLRRFRNESKAISSLDHPNIVKIYDVSFGNLIQYIVMEYVEGITLKEYIQQQGILNKNEALYYITQILRALQHAHDKGIIHRDIKPQNIMLMSNGTIKVTDFGIARISRSETRTMSTDAVGSIHYISPEQIKGGVTDAKSDIYSVGIVLYEMCTGKLPFDANNTAQVIFMQIESQPELPSKINPSILPGLEQIIIRAMQKNKSFRYQSSTEMLIDIETITRNPEARFNYNHFVDKQPTQKINNASDIIRQTQRPVQPRPSTQNNGSEQRPAQPRPAQQRSAQSSGNIPRRSQDPRYRAEMKKQLEKEKNSTKKTVISLVVVLVLLIGISLGVYFYFDKDSNRIVVPNFIGKNYSKEILNNTEYNMFKFEVVNEENNNIEEGQVVSQNPTGGKVERGSTVVLHVAISTEKLVVPDVYGEDFASAEYKLKTSGFVVTINRQPSATVEEGKVIRTAPAKGEEISEGAEITMYVASGEAVEKVAVPDLMGKTIEEAKDELEKVGLSLDSSHVEYRPSTMERGKIFGYDYRGEEVAVGTKIPVYVSKGNETTAVSTTASTTESTTVSTTAPTTTAPTTTAPTTTEPTTTEPTTTTTAPSTEAPTVDDTPVLDD